jgi:MoxR-like ATPase
MPFETKMTSEQAIEKLKNLYGTEITTADIKAFCAMNDITYQTVTKKLASFKVSKGKWNLEVTQKDVDQIERTFQSPAVLPASEKNLVPAIDETFFKFGNFTDVKKVIQSKQFYPTFITGLSGNGKTFSVEQACAQLGRELIRVNITIETDEDDLIGGFRLVDGATVWHNGPVIEALERGAILLLDEIDLASNKILCLQSVLEGNGVFLKKIGRFVKPARGFNILATANTKGKGSDDGRFIGTNVLNEAFLERFPVTFEQSYPSVNNEIKLLGLHADRIGVIDAEFIKKLVDWADIIRKTFYDGGIEDLISTRRLVHIVRAFSIFKNKAKAIQVCINRFDDETKQSFLELYDKVDADFEMPETNEEKEN